MPERDEHTETSSLSDVFQEKYKRDPNALEKVMSTNLGGNIHTLAVGLMPIFMNFAVQALLNIADTKASTISTLATTVTALIASLILYKRSPKYYSGGDELRAVSLPRTLKYMGVSIAAGAAFAVPTWPYHQAEAQRVNATAVIDERSACAALNKSAVVTLKDEGGKTVAVLNCAPAINMSAEELCRSAQGKDGQPAQYMRLNNAPRMKCR